MKSYCKRTKERRKAEGKKEIEKKKWKVHFAIRELPTNMTNTVTFGTEFKQKLIGPEQFNTDFEPQCYEASVTSYATGTFKEESEGIVVSTLFIH